MSSCELVSILVNTPTFAWHIMALNRLKWTIRFTTWNKQADWRPTAHRHSSLIFSLARGHSCYKKIKFVKSFCLHSFSGKRLLNTSHFCFNTLYRTVWFSTLSRPWNFTSIFVDTPTDPVGFSTLHFLVATVRFTFWKRATTKLDVRAWWR